eukprot:8809981-Alexandrium_andersonii.AAC.1
MHVCGVRLGHQRIRTWGAPLCVAFARASVHSHLKRPVVCGVRLGHQCFGSALGMSLCVWHSPRAS